MVELSAAMARGKKKKQTSAASETHTSARAPIDTIDSLYEYLIDKLEGGDPEPCAKALQSPQAADLVEIDKHRQDIFLHAVIQDHPFLVERRLELGKDPNCQAHVPDIGLPLARIFQHHGRNTFKRNSSDNWTLSVLHWAAICNSPKAMSQLIGAGANVNGRIPGTLQTPLHLLGLSLCYYSFPEKCLQKYKSQPDGAFRLKVQESLYTDVEMKQMQAEVIRAAVQLKSLGADIHAQDALGRCPIASAISAGQLHTASTLLLAFYHKGGDLNKFVGFLDELVEVEGAKGASCTPAAGGIKAVTRAFEQCFPGVIRLMPGQAADGLTHARQLVARLRSAPAMTRAKQLGAEQCHAWLCTWQDQRLGDLLSPAMQGKPRDENGSRIIRMVSCTIVAAGVRFDDAELLQSAQDLGLHLNVRRENDLLPLYRACKESKLAVLTQLCDKAPPGTLSHQLQECDPVHGVTPLGHAVAWGYLPEAAALVKACKRAGLDINPLLTRTAKESLHHLPLFSAVIHGYPAIIRLLLPAGLDLEHSACMEHFESSSGKYVQEPSAESESMTLLMCAASLGDSTLVELLLEAGAPARAAPEGNKQFINAVTMVLDHPDLDEQLRGSSPAPTLPHSDDVPDANGLWGRGCWPQDAGTDRDATDEDGGEASADSWAAATSANGNLPDEDDPSSPMGWMTSWLYDDAGPRFQCLLLLLRHAASLSREQLAKLHVILQACAGTYKEGDALAKLVRKRVKACENCQAYGCWKQCACKLSWYCSTSCQQQMWALHKQACKQARSRK